MEKFPFIDNGLFTPKLYEYASQTSFNKILVVYGSKGIGKSYGLRHFAENISKNGRLVLDFDFSYIRSHSTLEDYISVIAQGIINGFLALQNGEFDFNKIEAGIPKNIQSSFFPTDSVLKRYFIGFNNNKSIQRAISFLLSKIDTKKMMSKSLYDTISNFQFLSPLIIVHHPHRLMKSQGCTAYCDDSIPFISKLFSSTHNNNGIGIIFEISKVSDLSLFPQDSHELFNVVEFNHDHATEVFADGRMFTVPQINLLYEQFSGFGVYYSKVYHLCRKGYFFNEAIQLINNEILQDINLLLSDEKNESILKLQIFFNNLIQHKSIEMDSDPQISAYLIEKGYLSVLNGTHVSLANPAIKKALISSLETNSQ